MKTNQQNQIQRESAQRIAKDTYKASLVSSNIDSKGKYSIFDQHYPACDESALVKSETEYAVQVNSKIKTKMKLASDLTEEQIRAAVLANDVIQPLVQGAVIKKFIVVPGRLINIIL